MVALIDPKFGSRENPTSAPPELRLLPNTSLSCIEMVDVDEPSAGIESGEYEKVE